MDEIEKTWASLLDTDSNDPTSRVVRLLGTSAVGVRASVIPVDKVLELLIEVPSGWNKEKRKLPEWRGMGFATIAMSIPPRPDNHQLVLTLRDDEQKSIFLAYCNDLVDNLEGIKSPKERVEKIDESILRWGRFFEKCGTEGLNEFQQSGLFGELSWLEKLIDSKLGLQKAVEAWKGCERNFHDFDVAGHVIEVKTSMTKEPQQITVNNERQLDERGLSSLHLFFVAIRKAEGGGTTLPERVDSIKVKLGASPAALLRFGDCLVNAGYHEHHAPKYKSHFIVKEEMLFHVRDNFPRIIDPPDGVGSLTYGVLISSCRSFDTNIQEHIAALSESQA